MYPTRWPSSRSFPPCHHRHIFAFCVHSSSRTHRTCTSSASAPSWFELEVDDNNYTGLLIRTVIIITKLKIVRVTIQNKYIYIVSIELQICRKATMYNTIRIQPHQTTFSYCVFIMFVNIVIICSITRVCCYFHHIHLQIHCNRYADVIFLQTTRHRHRHRSFSFEDVGFIFSFSYSVPSIRYDLCCLYNDNIPSTRTISVVVCLVCLASASV